MLNVEIIYCEHCNYLPRAKEFKRRLEESYGDNIEVFLAAGSTGIFDVYVQGDMVFSKYKELRFPDFEEIKGAIDSRLARVEAQME